MSEDWVINLCIGVFALSLFGIGVCVGLGWHEGKRRVSQYLWPLRTKP